MLLSIIVPVYNCIEFLPRLSGIIEGIQSEDFEIILVDDGSTDGGGSACDEIAIKNSRVKVLHKPNGGAASARNAGLEAASGEYIGFMDADDSVRSDMYSRLFESAKLHGSDMVMGGYFKVFGEKREHVVLPLGEVETDNRKVIWSMAFWNAWTDSGYLPTIYGSVWPNLYKKALIKNNNIRFPEGVTIGEDLLFNIEYLSYVKRISVVNEPLYEYNIANSSATRKQNKNLWRNYCTLLEKEAELLRRLYTSDESLEYNLHRQRINYAINVWEEQTCVFFGKKDAVKEIKKMCSDEKLRVSAKTVMRGGKNKKERLQAALIYSKSAGLIWRWLG